MGKQLAPEDPLFSGTGAVSGATAGGWISTWKADRAAWTSTSRRAVAGEAPQGVDLDIGAAVGDHGTAESPTNVTDRNAALLENTFLSTTGTTRQMTARMRQDGAATGSSRVRPWSSPRSAAPRSTPPYGRRSRRRSSKASRRGAGARRSWPGRGGGRHGGSARLAAASGPDTRHWSRASTITPAGSWRTRSSAADRTPVPPPPAGSSIRTNSRRRSRTPALPCGQLADLAARSPRRA